MVVKIHIIVTVEHWQFADEAVCGVNEQLKDSGVEYAKDGVKM